MSSVPKQRFTVDEFLAREEKALEKSEYYRGEILAMSGGSPNHNRISTYLLVLVANHLAENSTCEALGSD